MLIVGLSGKARAGKSAVAEILRDRWGFEIIGFADLLKRTALAIDPIVDIDLDGDPWHLTDVVEEYGMEGAKDRFPEVRRFLQRLGTEGVRNHLGPDAWVDAWNHAVDTAYMHRAPRGIAVPDVRFENEAQAILDRDGWLWQIERAGDHDPSGAAGHASENGIPPLMVTHVVINHGTLDQLAARVGRLVESL